MSYEDALKLTRDMRNSRVAFVGIQKDKKKKAKVKKEVKLDLNKLTDSEREEMIKFLEAS